MNLKLYRNTNNISQQKFADMLCVHRVTLCNWENGKKFPNPDNFVKITKVTEGHVTPNDFYLNG